VPAPFLLRSDNRPVFASRHYTRRGAQLWLEAEFITPHCLQQNGMVEGVN
jgi:putative transposase